MNRRKRAKENLQYFRKNPEYAPTNKNAASTVWVLGTRSINGVAFLVYTTRPNGGNMNYATRLCDATKDREDTKRYVEAYRRYRPELLRWQQQARNDIEKFKESFRN